MDDWLYAMPGVSIPLPEDKVFCDPVLGEFRLPWTDVELGLWRGKTEISGRMVGLAVSLLGKSPLEDVLPFCRDVVSWVGQNERELGARIVQELLDTYNQGWRWEDEKELTAEEFPGQLSLGGISVGAYGSNPKQEKEAPFAEVHYDCGDLFGDHIISVFLDHRKAIKGVGLEG